MKTFLFLLLLLVLFGCESQPANTGPMQGVPVEGQMEAYTKMCLRDPASILCPQDEFFVTNADDLNARWCKMCAEDSSYSWCKHFKECITEKKPTRTTNTMSAVEPKGETMQGRAVRVRAQAYIDLCARTPESILCK